MAILVPSSLIASISGRYSKTDRVHARAHTTTGRTYGVAMTHPNKQSAPTESQQQARAAFRDTWHTVDAILADDAACTYYTALWHAHTAACRHHRPLSQTTLATLPAQSASLAPALLELQISRNPASPALQSVQSSQIPLSEGAGGVLFLLRSRRTPFSTARTLLFYLLYHT